jgi:RND family efflux transporter MFP subunit
MNLHRLEKLKLDHPQDDHLDYRRPRKRWGILLLVLLIFVGAGGAYYMSQRVRPTEQKETVAKASQDQSPAPAPVIADTDIFTAAGYLEPVPPYPITVSAMVAGRIDEFSILEGTPIHAGQVVAKLDSAPLQLQRAELQAQNGVAEAKLNQARTILERTQQLAPIGSASTKDLDRAKAEVAIAEAEQRQIAAVIARVTWQIENTEIRAPIDGVVFERLKNVGEFVAPDSGKDGAALLTLYDPTKIQAWVDVTQRDASRVSVGQHVDISLDAAPGKTYEGRVIRILPRASLQKNTIQVKVSIPDPTPMFRPDMSVKITFHADHIQVNAAKQ